MDERTVKAIKEAIRIWNAREALVNMLPTLLDPQDAVVDCEFPRDMKDLPLDEFIIEYVRRVSRN